MPLSNASLLFIESLRAACLRGLYAVFAARGSTASLSRSRVSRGIESVTPVPRADGDTLRDCKAETVHDSISTPAGAAWGCWDGGGTELKIAMIASCFKLCIEDGILRLIWESI